MQQPEPKESECIGQVKIGDTGFSTNCSYEIAIESAKLEARKVGGNAIKIIEHKSPTALGSTCHRLTARILKIENPEAYKQKESIDSLMFKEGYAMLHIYRNSGIGPLINYDLHLGDSTICRVENKWQKSLKISQTGLNTLWAKTEVKRELPIKIEPGKEYYIRCGITMGILVGEPSLELVGNVIGKSEFAATKPHITYREDLILLKDGRKIECKIIKKDDNKVYFSIVKNGQKIDTSINKERVRSIKQTNLQ